MDLKRPASLPAPFRLHLAESEQEAVRTAAHIKGHLVSLGAAAARQELLDWLRVAAARLHTVRQDLRHSDGASNGQLPPSTAAAAPLLATDPPLESGAGRVAECESSLEGFGSLVHVISLAHEVVKSWDHHLPSAEDSEAQKVATLMFGCCVDEMGAMQQLVLDFNKLILPETIKAVLTGDASIHATFGELARLNEDVSSWRRAAETLESVSIAQAAFEATYQTELQKAQQIVTRLGELEDDADDLGWEEADERAEQLAECNERIESLELRWTSRVRGGDPNPSMETLCSMWDENGRGVSKLP